MKKTIKKKWLAALRSGKYKQTEGMLKNKEGFCCLGVLCDLYVKSHKATKWDGKNQERNGKKAYAVFGENGIVPKQVMDWAGLSSANPSVKFKEAHTSLAGLNDNYNLNFKGIAKVIDVQL